MSRNKILQNIRENLPESRPLPEIPHFDTPGSLLDLFTGEALKSSRVLQLGSHETNYKRFFDGYGQILDLSQNVKKGHTDLDVLIVNGTLGVAENGAIWVDEKSMGARILPFAVQHLGIVLDSASIVGNMHEAYQKISIDKTGFGVFIAGPSKTADIEQSLVVGAHGPRSLTIFLKK